MIRNKYAYFSLSLLGTILLVLLVMVMITPLKAAAADACFELESRLSTFSVWGWSAVERAQPIFDVAEAANGELVIATGLGIEKVDSEGREVWKRGNETTSIADVNDYVYIRAVQALSTSEYVVAGSRTINDSNRYNYIAKVSSAGVPVWQKRINAGDYEWIKLIETSDGGIVFVTPTRKEGGGELSPLVMKFRSDGSLQWQKVLYNAAHQNNQNFQDIAPTQDGGLMLVSHFPASPTTFGYAIVKLSSGGSLVWRKYHASTNGTDHSLLSGVAEDPSGNLYVTGGYTPWVMKLDRHGNRLWSKRYTDGNHPWNLHRLTISGFSSAGNLLVYESSIPGGDLFEIDADGDVKSQRSIDTSSYRVCSWTACNSLVEQSVHGEHMFLFGSHLHTLPGGGRNLLKVDSSFNCSSCVPTIENISRNWSDYEAPIQNGGFSIKNGSRSVTDVNWWPGETTTDNVLHCSVVQTSNGSCGTSDGGTFSSQPTTNLCTSPGPAAWTDTNGSNGTYNWQCLASGAGSSADCSATKQQDATCGSSNGGTFDTRPAANLCGTGSTFLSWTDGSGSDSEWNWECESTTGGANASCSATVNNTPPTVSNAGVCGSATSTAHTATPTSNLCSDGTASAVTETTSGPRGWEWDCAGADPANTVSCAAAKVPDITIEADPDLIRSGQKADLEVTITADWDLSCEILNAKKDPISIDHSADPSQQTYSGAGMQTRPLIHAQIVSLFCAYPAPFDTLPPAATSTRINVVPTYEEI